MSLGLILSPLLAPARSSSAATLTPWAPQACALDPVSGTTVCCGNEYFDIAFFISQPVPEQAFTFLYAGTSADSERLFDNTRIRFQMRAKFKSGGLVDRFFRVGPPVTGGMASVFAGPGLMAPGINLAQGECRIAIP